jgi:DNA helicase-2/ATP-dependent DNA helicase PcrA
LDFEKDYPDAKVVLLEQNYRSTKYILASANALIQNNGNRIKKNLFTDETEGKKVHLYRGTTEKDEANFVIEQILQNSDTRKYKDFAVLYRTNAQSRVMEEALLKSNIAYTMVGGHKFYDRQEIRDIISYLNILSNHRDGFSFRRIINKPKRGIGPKSLEKLDEFRQLYNFSEVEATMHISLSDITGKAGKELDTFGQMMVKILEGIASKTVTEITETVLNQSGYLADLKQQKSIEAQTRIENLEEFLSVTKHFDEEWEPVEGETRLSSFLNDLALVSDVETEDAAEKNEVTLMTIHAAKGLEFPVVFVLGVEEGVFPLKRAMEEIEELEEERRLAYVAITRAEEELFLLHAEARTLYGETKYNRPSRFLSELGEENTVSSGSARTRNTSFNVRYADGDQVFSGGKRMSLEQAMASLNVKKTKEITPFMKNVEEKKSTVVPLDWAVGDIALHKLWGEGVVRKLHGAGEDLELDIAFPEKGMKRLLVKFAPITKK